MPDFLLEVGLEEVPARMLSTAERDLGERILALLRRERLDTAHIEHETFSTPRRLAVLVHGVNPKQPDAEEQLTGPAWAIAFKDGAPTPAAHAFAKKAGVAVEQLRPVTTPKGEYVSATLARPGRAAAEVLSELVPKEIAALGWPKPMYWRAGKPERFVRPVRWLLALLDSEVVPFEFAGVQAGRLSYGHRVLHGSAPIEISQPAQYLPSLLAAKVMVEVAARRHRIRKQLDAVTRTVASARWREDEPLVETVTHLVEWPSVVLGSFASEYLALPEEVLVTVMRDHQKYFAVEDKAGKLLPHFLAVLNTQADAIGEAVIRHGNERVLRARFSDARFFWEVDQKTPLADRVESLRKVTFQKDLGSYWEKTERTREIAASLAATLQAAGVAVDTRALDRATLLAKADLTTELVKEFTELQGVIGGLYARAAGEPEAVAQAIYHQYRPAAITDPIPPTPEGQVLGLADRIGTLVDLFGKGLAPSGSRDPYALRRAGNAIVKILAVSKLPITLTTLINAAPPLSDDVRAATNPLVEQNLPSNSKAGYTPITFLKERLEFYANEYEQIPMDVVKATTITFVTWEPGSVLGWEDVPDMLARGKALAKLKGSPDLQAISAAWKRMFNIIHKNPYGDNYKDGAQVDPALFREEAEHNLWSEVNTALPEIEALRQAADYQAALERIALLRPAIDHFFDRVLVITEDVELRTNRLNLLVFLERQLGRIAWFSELTPV